MAGWAKHSRMPSMQKFGAYDEAVELITHAPKDMVVLGAEDDEFSTGPVGIPYDGYQFNTILMGKKGSGKTSIMWLMIDQLFHRFHHPVLVIDPFWEGYTHAQAQEDVDLRNRLKEYGLLPEGLPIFNISPIHCVDPDETDLAGFVYKIDLREFKRIKKPDARLQILKEFFNLSETSSMASVRQLIEWNNKLPDTFEQLIQRLEQAGGKAQALLSALMAYTSGGSIGKGYKVNIPKMMEDLNGEKRVVVLQLAIDYEPVTAAYLKLALLDLIFDRGRAKRSGNGFLKSSPVIAIDEADIFANERMNIGSRPQIDKLSTKYRKYDLYNIAATQKPQYISRRIVGETDYIITSKLFQKEERDVLKERGLADDTIDLIFKDLKWEKGVYPKEHALIDPNGEWKTLFTLPSCSKMFKERRMFRGS